MNKLTKDDTVMEIDSMTKQKFQRRDFLRYAGAGAAGVGLIALGASCQKKNSGDPVPNDVGSGDIGVLNYAYALEQLEAAFYTQVVKTPYTGISSFELAAMTDIRDHEVLHRELFKAALGSSAIAGLSVDFSSINFSDRASVLYVAKSFEDTGVTAYNGAGFLLTNATYLTLAGKIVSVEARHAAFIRDLILNGTFADTSVLDANALDQQKLPSQVIQIANVFLTTKISANQLP